MSGARVNAVFAFHPRLKREYKVRTLMPRRSDHSISVTLSPQYLTIRLPRLFRCCTFRMAQRQLDFLYGPSFSMRSKVCFDDGRGPISPEKLTNLSHRLHAV